LDKNSRAVLSSEGKSFTVIFSDQDHNEIPESVQKVVLGSINGMFLKPVFSKALRTVSFVSRPVYKIVVS